MIGSPRRDVWAVNGQSKMQLQF